MKMSTTTPWHGASYDKLLNETLPQLLAERLPLTSYQTHGLTADRIQLSLTIAGTVELTYTLPYPDSNGVFTVDGAQIVVLPVASHEHLDTAEIVCVGEQLFELIAARLGEAPRHLVWDLQIAQTWLPLERWVREALTPQPNRADTAIIPAQYLDQTNWLATMTHIRRLIVQHPQQLFTQGQVGRACLFEVPEGLNIGRIFTIARGATIQDGRLLIVDDSPQAMLGLSASCSPLLEHNEYPRQLMGVNMLRQWLTPPDPEPALVQTGLEPDSPLIWCGRNLLTAYMSWDADTFEDGLVLSESAAQRLNYPAAVEPGDKFSNRHGAMGVISRILPDSAMPQLTDGTPVELIVSMMSVPSRLNFGQIREAVLGRIAHTTGQPVIVMPFQAPSAESIRAQLRVSGLPEHGMEILTVNGEPLMQPSTVGWVYWGKLVHTAASKLRCFTGDSGMPRIENELDAPDQTMAWPMWTPTGQRQGELEYYALRRADAFETIREQYNTRSAAHPDAPSLAQRLASGALEQAGPPTPMFRMLQRRLAAAGIRASLDQGQLTFVFAPPRGNILQLAQAVPHPWLHEETLTAIGNLPEHPIPATLLEANTRLAGMLNTGTPKVLLQHAQKQLEAALADWCDTLLRPADLIFDQPTLFSARAVAAPGGMNLRYDQVGLPETIAWELFGPLLGRTLGDPSAVQQRTPQALAALDTLLAQSWVLVARAPSLQPEAFLAFRPIRSAEQVVRLPSLTCNLLDADYDGDQLAVFLPVTDAGQREAAERLSVAAHLTRNPGLIRDIRPRMDALLGLALLSLTQTGLADIQQACGVVIDAPDGYLSAPLVVAALAAEYTRAGAIAALDLSERLAHLGFSYIKQSGLSIGPFIGEHWGPAKPHDDSPVAWQRYVNTIEAHLGAQRDFDGDVGDVGGVILALLSHARGNFRLFTSLVATRYQVTSLYNSTVAIYGNMRDGLRVAELISLIGDTRTGMAEMNRYWERDATTLRSQYAPRGEGVLARAMQAAAPGVVFALAARAGTIDRLSDTASRLFVGLLPM